jgi:hypothetical protein
MTRYTAVSPAPALLAAAVSLLLFAVGCSSTAKSPAGDDRSPADTSAEHRTIDVNCMADRIANPRDSFHYSFKAIDEQNTVVKEAEVSPQTIDITIQQAGRSHSYHGIKSDQSNWDTAVLSLSGSGLLVMTTRLDFIKDTSSLKRVDNGTVNGYSAAHYSIDTANANSSDKKTFETMFGSGSYDKGDLWVAVEGCPIKLILDEARQQPNGIVAKSHFEVNFIKK